MSAAHRVVLCLLLLLGLGACSSMRLGYTQAPRLLGWWLDDYVELDAAQRRLRSSALRALQDWHRREELPRWRAALLKLEAATATNGLQRDELLQLEQALADSVERSLAQAAPLAQPLLASLSAQQWQQIEAALVRQLQEGQQRAAEQTTKARGRAFERSLRRWLGALDAAQGELARLRAAAWPVEVERRTRERALRQAEALAGLRLWSAGRLQEGTQRLMAASHQVAALRTPAETQLRARVLADVLAVWRAGEPAHHQAARAQWADWAEQLRALQVSAPDRP